MALRTRRSFRTIPTYKLSVTIFVLSLFLWNQVTLENFHGPLVSRDCFSLSAYGYSGIQITWRRWVDIDSIPVASEIFLVKRTYKEYIVCLRRGRINTASLALWGLHLENYLDAFHVLRTELPSACSTALVTSAKTSLSSSNTHSNPSPNSEKSFAER